MIAMALACGPKLLIADEPTTALDVTIQAQILDLMRGLRRETGTAIILITHDLGVVAEMADDVAVMYAGQIVERAPVARCSRGPSTPTRWACWARSPSSTRSASACPRSRAGCPTWPHPPEGCRFAAAARSSSRPAATPCRRWSKWRRTSQPMPPRAARSAVMSRWTAPSARSFLRPASVARS